MGVCERHARNKKTGLIVFLDNFDTFVTLLRKGVYTSIK